MESEDDRIKQLETIRNTVREHQNHLNEVLQQFGWTVDKLPKYKQEIEHPNIEVTPDPGENTQERAPKEPKDDLEAVVNLCSTISQKQSATNTFTDLNKLRRDLKRRRVKYRTTKTAPLSYTEELRELINLQMDLVKNKE